MASLAGRQQRLLHLVLGVLDRTEDPVAVHLQLAPVRVNELGKRHLVTGSGTGDQIGTRHAQCHHLVRWLAAGSPVQTPPPG